MSYPPQTRVSVSSPAQPVAGNGGLLDLPPLPQASLDARGRPRMVVRRFAGSERHAEHLDHLRIAHLTDLHVGRITPMRVQMDAVRITNAAQPDLVALTGDFVCHGQRYLDELTTVVAAFDAPVVCVLGNHDHWSGAAEVRRALRRAGAEVLDNANTTITLRNQRLAIVGVDDEYTGHADWRRALAGLPAGVAVLGLSHIAEVADAMWSQGVPLVLSGHTHAGHVTLAKLNELAIGRIGGHKYVHGLYGTRQVRRPSYERADGLQRGAVYVGAGIGASVIPLRVGPRARREVTLFELGLLPGSFHEEHGEQVALPGRDPSPETKHRRATKVQSKRRLRELRSLLSDKDWTNGLILP